MTYYVLVDETGAIMSSGTTAAEQVPEGWEQVETEVPQLGHRWDSQARAWTSEPMPPQPVQAAPEPVQAAAEPEPAPEPAPDPQE